MGRWVFERDGRGRFIDGWTRTPRLSTEGFTWSRRGPNLEIVPVRPRSSLRALHRSAVLDLITSPQQREAAQAQLPHIGRFEVEEESLSYQVARIPGGLDTFVVGILVRQRVHLDRALAEFGISVDPVESSELFFATSWSRTASLLTRPFTREELRGRWALPRLMPSTYPDVSHGWEDPWRFWDTAAPRLQMAVVNLEASGDAIVAGADDAEPWRWSVDDAGALVVDHPSGFRATHQRTDTTETGVLTTFEGPGREPIATYLGPAWKLEPLRRSWDDWITDSRRYLQGPIECGSPEFDDERPPAPPEVGGWWFASPEEPIRVHHSPDPGPPGPASLERGWSKEGDDAVLVLELRANRHHQMGCDETDPSCVLLRRRRWELVGSGSDLVVLESETVQAGGTSGRWGPVTDPRSLHETYVFSEVDGVWRERSPGAQSSAIDPSRRYMSVWPRLARYRSLPVPRGP